MQSTIVYRKEMAAILLLYCLSCLALVIVLAHRAGGGGPELLMIALMFLPIVLAMRVMSFFSRTVMVSLSSDALSMTVYDRNGQPGTPVEYPFSTLQSYTILLPRRKFAVLRLRQAGGRTTEYSFRMKQVGVDDVETPYLMETLVQAMKEHHVPLKPSFFSGPSIT